MTPHPELLSKTADELREMANASNRRSEESFARSDTDGCVSQWASDTMASLYRHAAALAEQGWMAEADELFDAETGARLFARLVLGTYGESFVYDDEDGNACWVGRSSAQKPARAAAHYAKKGVTLGVIRERVVPAMAGRGRGLSGSAWASHMRDRDFGPEAAEVVTTNRLSPEWVAAEEAAE